MTSDLACRQNMERELAPDLLPPVAWNEKQRLLTKLVQPVTPLEVCAAVLMFPSERACISDPGLQSLHLPGFYHDQVCKSACMRACPVRIALATVQMPATGLTPCRDLIESAPLQLT